MCIRDLEMRKQNLGIRRAAEVQAGVEVEMVVELEVGSASFHQRVEEGNLEMVTVILGSVEGRVGGVGGVCRPFQSNPVITAEVNRSPEVIPTPDLDQVRLILIAIMDNGNVPVSLHAPQYQNQATRVMGVAEDVHEKEADKLAMAVMGIAEETVGEVRLSTANVVMTNMVEEIFRTIRFTRNLFAWRAKRRRFR